jgi:Allene oxide cyclase barrel like domain
MQRKWLVVSITGLIAALTASTAAIAISNKAPIKSKTTLTFALQAVAGDNIDLGQPGQSVGDEFVSSNLLLKKGAKVGRLESVCTLTNTSPLSTVCEAALRLNSGQITLMGRVPGAALSGQADVKVAIVGGTGAYRHSHGYATVDTTAAKVTLVLTP